MLSAQSQEVFLVAPEDFVFVWETSECPNHAAERLSNLSDHDISAFDTILFARKLRALGVTLKLME